VLGPSGLGEVVGVVVDVCVSVPCSEAAIGVDVGPPRWGNHVGGHGALGDGEQRAVRGLTFGVDGERMAVQWRVMAVSRRCRAVLSSSVDVVDRGDVLRCGDTDDVWRLWRSFFFLYPLYLLARVCRGWPPGGGGARDRARATGVGAFIAEPRPWHGASGWGWPRGARRAVIASRLGLRDSDAAMGALAKPISRSLVNKAGDREATRSWLGHGHGRCV